MQVVNGVYTAIHGNLYLGLQPKYVTLQIRGPSKQAPAESERILLICASCHILSPSQKVTYLCFLRTAQVGKYSSNALALRIPDTPKTITGICPNKDARHIRYNKPEACCTNGTYI